MKLNLKENIKQKLFSVSPMQILKDLLSGVIVALVSIPISMGYAQIAGLPMVYGLYGSVFPILIFGMLTSSKDFVFGVDAAPAALVGGLIASLGIIPESEQAVSAVPTIAFLVGCWLFLFFILRAGKIVKYISTPVMGGFVTGICLTIIMMQVPKLFGGKAGMGEAPELFIHIIKEASCFNGLSMLLGLVTVALILLGKRFVPKLPMSVAVMAAGAVLSRIADLEGCGVKLLPHTDPGFPGFHVLPTFSSADQLNDLLFGSLSIAAVILSESLLASRSNAMKDGYRLDSSREILAYSAANFASAFSGCLPANGSVSRTGIVRQNGAMTQWMSIGAAGAMLAVLFAGCFMIEWLPVPVLTAIVIGALLNACEFHEAARLFRCSRREFYIFLAAMLGVLMLGTVYGVVVGIVLSFVAVIIQAVIPPRAFMGVIRGRDGFYSLDRSNDARPVRNALIYRFGGNLFFANIDVLQNDIENAIADDTKIVVINAGAVSSIDVTAADRLLLLYKDLERRGIRMYFTEHIGEVNDMLRASGAAELLRNGCVRMTAALALRDAGIPYPYPTDERSSQKDRCRQKLRLRREMRHTEFGDTAQTRSALGIQAEVEWALGKEAGNYMEHMAKQLLRLLDESPELTDTILRDAERSTPWGRLNFFDEDELIDRMEIILFEIQRRTPEKAVRVENFLEKRRRDIEHRMLVMDPEILGRLRRHRQSYGAQLRASDPEGYQKLLEKRREYYRRLQNDDPQLAGCYEKVYGSLLTEEVDGN